MLPNQSYEAALSELFKLEFTGMKLGLENIRALLESLGNPHRSFKSIHVAGSNGKGSVSAMLSAALQGNGYRVGLYTSPHLVSFRERVKVGDEPISEAHTAEILSAMWPMVEQLHATFFEVTTALAFKYFALENVDVAVIETGLGGRLDATNALECPLATVVTSISLEHTQFLGDTLELIAGEKAGIFKHGAPAVVHVDPMLRHVFEAKAADVGTSVLFADDVRLSNEYAHLQPPLEGLHQEKNLKTVLAALAVIGLRIDPKRTCEGIAHTVILTGLRARLEAYGDERFTSRGASLILDVGHNPDAFHMLASHFLRAGIRPVVVIGLAKDKALLEVLGEVARFASRVITTQADHHRAAPSAELATMARILGLRAEDGGAVVNAVAHAAAGARGGEVYLLCGSHYVVGEYLARMERDSTIKRN